MYGGEHILPFIGHERFELINGDIRDQTVVENAVQDIDAVVNLAALVGEPLCNKFPSEAVEINYASTIRLADVSARKGVKRFITASTCSNYGLGNVADNLISEEGQLDPLSVYSQTKVGAEKYVISMRSSMDQIVLRFATLFGLSPRMRFDLLLNEFVRDAHVKHKIQVFGGQAWRPIVHVRDAAKAVEKCLAHENYEKPEVFNVGSNELNFRKLELAKMAAEPFAAEVEELPHVLDKRNYSVNFDKVHRYLGFNVEETPKHGIDEMAGALRLRLVSAEDQRYSNPLGIQWRIPTVAGRTQ
jgi:nucleoside-diphosphate-sugar epimerase